MLSHFSMSACSMSRFYCQDLYILKKNYSYILEKIYLLTQDVIEKQNPLVNINVLAKLHNNN